MTDGSGDSPVSEHVGRAGGMVRASLLYGLDDLPHFDMEPQESITHRLTRLLMWLDWGRPFSERRHRALSDSVLRAAARDINYCLTSAGSA